jgi:tRNA-2-methylthio-N6-dimethylallyladenosine synthase
MKFFVRTFGCQMNENDSEHIAGILAHSGAARAAAPEDADVIIVNTCAVREKSEEKLYSYLGRLSSLKKKRGVLIGVAGCVAQVYRNRLFNKRPFIDFVVGPDNYLEIPAIVAKAASGPCIETGWSRSWREFGHGETLRDSGTSAFVTVMEGCDNFCAYCVVPFSRGREKFRPFEKILQEVRELAGAGYKEVQFLGQNVNSYRDPETGRDFAALLDEGCAVAGVEWVRFLTSHPRNIGDDIIRAMARNPKVCRQIHLPLQSGSTAVLERMNRGYSRDDYLALAARLKEALPGILLTTDIIVGFPGETEADFEETCDVLRRVRFAGVFSFRYSPRPMTAAARMTDDVPLEVKRRRLLSLQNLQKTIQREVNETFVGRGLRVLCLGPSPKGAGRIAARTEGNLVVNFTSPLDVIGRFVTVRITGCGPYSLHGELAG